MKNRAAKSSPVDGQREGGSVSGHGQREAVQLVEAVIWKDRIIDDLRSEQGRLSAREHQVSVELISEAAILVASHAAGGEVLSPDDAIRRALTATSYRSVPGRRDGWRSFSKPEGMRPRYALA